MVYPGHVLLYVSLQCPSQAEIDKFLQNENEDYTEGCSMEEDSSSSEEQIEAYGGADTDLDFLSVIDEDNDQYAFFHEDEGSEEEPWNDGEEQWEVRNLRGTPVTGHRSPGAPCKAATALWEEAPALEVKLDEDRLVSPPPARRGLHPPSPRN